MYVLHKVAFSNGLFHQNINFVSFFIAKHFFPICQINPFPHAFVSFFVFVTFKGIFMYSYLGKLIRLSFWLFLAGTSLYVQNYILVIMFTFISYS